VHTFTSTATDAAGNVGNGTGSVIYGTTGNDTLASPTGHDIMTGGGGLDTFVFAAPKFGNDVITDFQTQSAHHDIIQFSQTDFNSFAAVLAHAAQVGSNVVINADANDTITLNNVQLNKLTSADFHFV
jgi:Ca2+-binding RTX toxin-like protein